MANEELGSWRPDWVVPPGEILLDALTERGMTQSELARRTGRPIKTINEIAHGKAAITAETALQFERVLGISAAFWHGAETTFRDQLARRNELEVLRNSGAWANEFPIDDLKKVGMLSDQLPDADLVASILQFFCVSSPTAWEKTWLNPRASFRSSTAFAADPKAVSSWLRWGEIEAQKIEAPPFNKSAFRSVLANVSKRSQFEPIDHAIGALQAECAQTGVIIQITPEFKGCRVSGATRWIGGNPLIQLSCRYKSDDHFWFTFLHEAAHALQAFRSRAFLDVAPYDATSNELEEQRANDFARDTLLDPQQIAEFVAVGDFSEAAVRGFAKSQQISPGIVIGRLQREGILKYSQLNRLKKKIQLAFW